MTGVSYQATTFSAHTEEAIRGFKGLKQAIKLEFKFGRYDKVGDAR